MRGLISWLSLGPALLGVAVWQLRPTWFVARLGSTDAWLGAVASPPPRALDQGALERGEPVRIAIDRERSLGRTDRRFLSVAIDTSQLVGGHFWSPSGKVEVGRGSERVPPLDLTRPELVARAKALGPAYLRVGGTEADYVYYAVGAASSSQRPSEYELELDEPTWNSLTDFARAAGFELMFTINAGPSARDEDGAWLPDNAERLFEYAAARGDSVAVWELGNELNGYWFIHGLRHQPSGAQYARDLWSFRHALARHFEDAKVAGPASVYFPGVGEPLFDGFDFLPEALEAGGPALDIVTWHYYPEQSRRCPIATRRAHPGQLLAPAELDEVDHWASRLEQLRDAYAPSARLWLGETGPAQCGGEPGLSDRYASGLWWLDQLGKAARSGHAVVIRQTLVGSDYGLLDGETLEPRPDYHNCRLWRKLMGQVVLDAQVSPGNPYVRAYAHCSAELAGAVTLLVLNLHPERAARVEIADGPPELLIYALSAPALDSERLYLNGTPLARGANDQSGRADDPAQSGTDLQGRWVANEGTAWMLPPASYTFFELPSSGTGRDVPACDGTASGSAGVVGSHGHSYGDPHEKTPTAVHHEDQSAPRGSP
jgi:heparanase 1